MIVLTIGAIFVLSLVFFFYLIFGKIEDENQGIRESWRSENKVPAKAKNERFVPLRSFEVKPEKEVVMK